MLTPEMKTRLIIATVAMQQSRNGVKTGERRREIPERIREIMNRWRLDTPQPVKPVRAVNRRFAKPTYTIKAHPTKYAGVMFRSRLEARWAVFFTLAGWKWQYEPIDFNGWTPDFRVEFPCGHSECNGSHVLFAEVKPYYTIKEFDGHPCRDFDWGCGYEGHSKGTIPADASAAFGIDPSVSYWQMAHGAGGGEDSVPQWEHNWEQMWKQAGNIVQWQVNGR